MKYFIKNFLKNNLSYNLFFKIKSIYYFLFFPKIDLRRFWNGEEIENIFENSFFKILGKQIKQKKITIKNQTINSLLVNKKIIFKKIKDRDVSINIKFFFKGRNKKNKLCIKNYNKIILQISDLQSNIVKDYQFNLKDIYKKLLIENKSNNDLFIAIDEGVRIEENPRNYIVIVLDSLNSDLFYKNINSMRHTKFFFKNSYHYRNFFTNAEWTVPSLTSLITGTHPSTHCYTDLKTSHQFDFYNSKNNIFSYYKKNNFKVHLLTRSKGHNPQFNFDHGLDSFFYFPYLVGNEADDEKIIKNTCDLLKKNSSYNNFFLLHLISTHPPYNNPKKKNTPSQLITEFMSFSEKRGATKALNEFTKTGKRINLNRLKLVLLEVDKILNKLYSFIIKKKLLSNTTVAITSDHGPVFLANTDFLFHRTRSQIPLLIKRPHGKKKNLYQFESLYNLKNILEDKKKHQVKKFDNYSISESIFNNKYECGIYYKKYTFLYSCEVNQNLKKIFLYENNHMKILFNNEILPNKKSLKKYFWSILVNHLNNSEYKIVN